MVGEQARISIHRRPEGRAQVFHSEADFYSIAFIRCELCLFRIEMTGIFFFHLGFLGEIASYQEYNEGGNQDEESNG